jgi:hypothetical protein
MGQDYKLTIKDIEGSKKQKIHLASGGGWVARIYPKGAAPTARYIKAWGKREAHRPW